MTAWAEYQRAVRGLDALALELTEAEIVQAGVDIAQAVTDSRIAYLHFLNEDQNSIELGAWSHETMTGCKAVYSRHYPVDSAGIWADSARTGKPCVHNFYESQSGNRGLPPGHSRVIRHLGMPVIHEGKVRLLVGVGNKSSAYDDTDIEALDMVARRVWSMVRLRRTLGRYGDLERRFRHVQEFAAVCGLDYDLEEDALSFDSMFGKLFGAESGTETPGTLPQFLAFVVAADRDRVREALSAAVPGRQVLRIGCLRVGGDPFPADLKVEFRRREIGSGMIAVGILQDVSEQRVVEDLRRRADTDPLTGLPNRRRLDALFSQVLGRRGGDDAMAFHYIDLDGFKSVNDTFGHHVGDEVLRLVANRLLQTVRKDDLLVRLGGDEFAIVQVSLEGADSALTLADKVIQTILEPLTALGHEVRVGASIGIAIGVAPDCRLGEISAAADHALYLAKAQGGARVVIAPRAGA